MTRTAQLLIAATFAAGGALSLVTLRPGVLPPQNAAIAPAAAQEVGTILYYQHPDGLPKFSQTPMKTPDGRDFVAVRESVETKTDSSKEASGAKKPRAIKFYRNPMGLPDTSPTPKKDSMGMDYIAVYNDDDDDGANVKISSSKLQKAGVRFELVERRKLGSNIRAPGFIQEDERRVSIVSFRFEGFIDSVENVTTGSHVRKGQPLMRVYSPALSTASAEYLSSLTSAVGPQGLKGARRRLENLGMPDQAISDLERTREISLSVSWLAPQDGEILERKAINGMRAAPGDLLFRIADHKIVWVLVDISERDLSLIAPGQKVEVRPRAFPDRSFSGAVELIYPHINPETRTARIRIELQNTDGTLRPDMYADVEISTGSDDAVLTVSESAVIDSGSKQVVLVDKGEGRFEPRAVKLGRRGNGNVEIKQGVGENEKIVASANFLIDAESNLKAALQGLTSEEKPQ